jgi:hypothetical protein
VRGRAGRADTDKEGLELSAETGPGFELYDLVPQPDLYDAWTIPSAADLNCVSCHIEAEPPAVIAQVET